MYTDQRYLPQNRLCRLGLYLLLLHLLLEFEAASLRAQNLDVYQSKSQTDSQGSESESASQSWCGHANNKSLSLLTCVVDLAVELLGVLRLELPKLPLLFILIHSVSKCFLVHQSGVIILQQELLLDMLWEQRFLLYLLRGWSRYHVHLGHVGDNLGVVLDILLLVRPHLPVDDHHFAADHSFLVLSLLLAVTSRCSRTTFAASMIIFIAAFIDIVTPACMVVLFCFDFPVSRASPILLLYISFLFDL